MAGDNSEARYERMIESALAPDCWVPYSEATSFIRRLESVADEIDKLIPTEPALASLLYETFLAGCHYKVEQIDDSDGELGNFVGRLYVRWTQARQASGATSAQTAKRLAEWMDDDPHGFCDNLEERAAEVLDEAGLAALIHEISARLEQLETKSADAEADETNLEWPRRRWTRALRALFRAQRNLDAYLALAEKTGLTAEDCLVIGTELTPEAQPEVALSWVERGIEIGSRSSKYSSERYRLTRTRWDLLVRLGRRGEALEAVWSEYRQSPGWPGYQELIKYVPESEREIWHERAIDAAKGTELRSLTELLVQTDEIALLAEVIRGATDDVLADQSHYYTEPAAQKLQGDHPDLAARLWCAQGLRIVNAGKSSYYSAALENFERARDCFTRAGLAESWRRVVEDVRSRHRRKSGFMPGFEQIVAGSSLRTPSFLERAKAQWRSRQPED
ncbi:MAG: hypothetical protein EHM61_23435 [Acidobacteria bacterium]|nr:MAG: hypothetical protein EHM61_23435 [Acidobacteriota bacterium]